MNDAIFKFKRYEDASLSYTGIDKNADKAVGGWDTVLRREEYERLFKYVWTDFWSYPLSLILYVCLHYSFSYHEYLPCLEKVSSLLKKFKNKMNAYRLNSACHKK